MSLLLGDQLKMHGFFMLDHENFFHFTELANTKVYIYNLLHTAFDTYSFLHGVLRYSTLHKFLKGKGHAFHTVPPIAQYSAHMVTENKIKLYTTTTIPPPNSLLDKWLLASLFNL